MLKLEQFREICDNDPDPTKYAYLSLPVWTVALGCYCPMEYR